MSSNMMPGLNNISDEVFTVDDIIERARRKPYKKKRLSKLQNKINNSELDLSQNTNDQDYAVISKLPTNQIKTPEAMPPMPSNIETGSLVVLTVDDPSSPAKKMLQTYIARGPGQLTPVAFPTTFLNSVVGYMKNIGQGLPQLLSPGSTASYESKSSGSGMPNVSVLPSPVKRQCHSLFTITQL